MDKIAATLLSGEYKLRFIPRGVLRKFKQKCAWHTHKFIRLLQIRACSYNCNCLGTLHLVCREQSFKEFNKKIDK